METQGQVQQSAPASESKKHWHDKHYKTLLLIPLALIIFSLIYLGTFYHKNGDFFYKDISLTGGTSVTINEKIDVQDLKQNIQDKLDEISIREIYDLVTNEQKAAVIETKSSPEDARKVLENYLGYELNDQNSSFEFTGSSLSRGFYKQLLIAMLIAFIFMGAVVFIIFKTAVPSMAVILAAFADILMALTAVNLLGIKLSTAGIVAFLMLIGYSVDTDILLTTRALKRREGTLNERLSEAMKTGMTMTLTSLFAFILILFIVKSFSSTLTQIFMVLSIGLAFDILNTWITNVSILKWYLKKKRLD